MIRPARCSSCGRQHMVNARTAYLGFRCSCGSLVQFGGRPGGGPMGPTRAPIWQHPAALIGGGLLTVALVTWVLVEAFSGEDANLADRSARAITAQEALVPVNPRPSPPPQERMIERPDPHTPAPAPRPSFTRSDAVLLAERRKQPIVDRHYDGGHNVEVTVRDYILDGSRRSALVELRWTGALSTVLDIFTEEDTTQYFWVRGWIREDASGWTWEQQAMSSTVRDWLLIREAGEFIEQAAKDGG